MELPEIFTQQTAALLGDEYPAFVQALSEECPVSIRINPSKPTERAGLNPVVWCKDGYYLEKRPLFTADPLFHAGCYYVQEASSMSVEQIIRQHIENPVICLDLCAAPGGKSTHLSALLPEGSLLVSNEVIRSRAHILAENLTKWGNPATIVTNNDPSEITKLKHLFDVILTDVPCSGEGMFRKDPKAREEWSPANVKLCAERQQRIIADIWNALKPGGLLIYSTCTYNTKENEENIEWMKETFGAIPLSVDTTSFPNISGSKKGNLPVYRFLPHLTRGEGFFIAAVQKPSDEVIFKERPKKIKPNPTPVPTGVKSWLKHSFEYNFLVKGNHIFAVPQKQTDIYHLLEKKLKIVSAGINIGEIKGKDVVPNHALAMSTALNKEAFPTHEVSRETALQYLSREAIHTLPAELPTSYILLTYQNHPLGFVKNIGNRANNLYPQEWRIRMKI